VMHAAPEPEVLEPMIYAAPEPMMVPQPGDQQDEPPRPPRKSRAPPVLKLKGKN
jgi:hypothetical protein